MTTHFTSHFRRLIGVLAGLSLLASLLVAVPGPTKAQAGPAPDYLATFEACPEDIIPDADFSDVSARNDNAGDIDCIAYYGITKGKTATTYAPVDLVIREHMALFLIRLAKLVDIYVPPPGETPFKDIDDLIQESQDAISQIYDLGITIGATSTTYAPGRNVSRGEMALFLQRLMDLMDVAADGGDAFGYVPDDVADNDGDFDVESPFRDLEVVSDRIDDAVTYLYELGVASGVSSRLYGPSRNMTRAVMAEFMAAILDHSNLRPRGVTVQVTPTRGNDDFEITMMISVRDDSFTPVEDQAVDWFYTDDSEDKGLLSNGECDFGEILSSGDCEWEEGSDDETNRDGNIFEDRIRATPGETMTFYAWIGSRDGDEFDEDDFSRDSTNFSTAEALSEKGPSSLLVEHDVSADAAQIDGDGPYLIDMDRNSSIEFTIQLQDEEGSVLEQEGVEIQIEIESREVVVDALRVRVDQPEPDFSYQGRAVRSDEVVVTDRDGEAVFELESPSRDERWDRVTITAECCREELRFDFAWSNSDPVLVDARPDFDFYQLRPNSGDLEFEVEYNLYDQYGNLLRGQSQLDTRRAGEVKATLEYQLYEAVLVDADDTDYSLRSLGVPVDKEIEVNRGRIPATVAVEADSLKADGQNGLEYEYLILLTPTIYSNVDDNDTHDSGEVKYVDSNALVWIVENASRASNLRDLKFASGGDLPDVREAELYSADRKFRTFFTMWDYDSGDRYQSGGEPITVSEFEALWRQVIGVEDIEIVFYGSTSFFLIDP